MKTISAEIYSELTKLGLKNVKAFTLDEMLELLPFTIGMCGLVVEKTITSEYVCGYFNALTVFASLSFIHKIKSKNPAEAAGKLLVWCIENGHVKVEDLNNDNKTKN